MNRRRVLLGMGAAGALGVLGAGRDAEAGAIGTGCPLSWEPNALEPVAHAVRDYWERDGAPTDLRVFFPSEDAPAGPILQGCGGYPLIGFFHGDCPSGSDEYLRWSYLPAQLARSGYVVVVPRIAGISDVPPVAAGTQSLLADVVEWMRQSWEYHALLMPPPATGLIGHSFGALHAGILATRVEVAAVASLSGGWNRWSIAAHGPVPIFTGSLPRLFTWCPGSDTVEVDAELSEPDWDQIPFPKHRAVFQNADHWAYLHGSKVPSPSGCVGFEACPNVGEATTDLVTMFFAKYLPPEGAPDLPNRVPDTLVPPPALELTEEQQAYAAGHLAGWNLMGDGPCQVEVTQVLGPDTVVPDVRNFTLSEAVAQLQAANLTFTVHGPTEPGTPRVFTQTPNPGVTVTVGTQVALVVRVDIEE